jgi:hypothetical protein
MTRCNLAALLHARDAKNHGFAEDIGIGASNSAIFARA